ncbi:exosortase/archaeosortase family protein [Promicromonospora sp. NPDC019610]|uniref:exosortase/archaeosortase family protein n=1 Tax=Promicromonospora sp. NPDC019610 TaxID=3364405 RepID=UPI0037966008
MFDNPSVAAALAPSAPRATGSLAPVARWLVAFGLVVATVLLVVREGEFRHLETALIGLVTGALFAREVRVMTDDPVFLLERVAGDDTTWFGLHVTQQCSAVLFLVPLAVIVGFVLVTGRSTVAKLLVAATGTAAFLELVNVARVELLVLTALRGGPSAFGWVHDTVGSAIMLGAFTVALLVFFRLGFLGRGGTARATGPHDGTDQA